jgi:hypothetical protein
MATTYQHCRVAAVGSNVVSCLPFWLMQTHRDTARVEAVFEHQHGLRCGPHPKPSQSRYRDQPSRHWPRPDQTMVPLTRDRCHVKYRNSCLHDPPFSNLSTVSDLPSPESQICLLPPEHVPRLYATPLVRDSYYADDWCTRYTLDTFSRDRTLALCLPRSRN